MDNHTPEVRSYNMSRIRYKNTKPEEIVRKYLFNQGFRYRKNVNNLPGCPDIVLPKYKTVVFINGCFWHIHNECSKFVWPKSNQEYWTKKLLSNQKRDAENYVQLEQMQWRIIVVWECELVKAMRDNRLQLLCEEIRKAP